MSVAVSRGYTVEILWAFNSRTIHFDDGDLSPPHFVLLTNQTRPAHDSEEFALLIMALHE